MTIDELYQQILSAFYRLDGAEALLNETVSVTPSAEPEKTLRPENDPPSTVARPEYCVTATLCGVKGVSAGPFGRPFISFRRKKGSAP